MVAPLRLGFPCRVDQTYCSDGTGYGSCLQAAVATLFGVPLDSVPDLRPNKTLPSQRFRLLQWLDSHKWIMEPIQSDQPYHGFYIASGFVERSIYIRHAVVMHDEMLYHDPHPCRKGLAVQQRVYLFSPRPLISDVRYAA